MSDNWYLLQTKPHKERLVGDLLRQRGIVVFLPTIAVTPVNGRAATSRPCFPGYIFCRLDPARLSVNALNYTPGSVGLVQVGAVPFVVTDKMMARVRRRVAQLQQNAGDAGDVPLLGGLLADAG